MKTRSMTRALLVVFPVAAILCSIPFYPLLEILPIPPAAWLGLALAALLYCLAHLLRAVRLALLAAPALNMQMRTVALLHFHTAPVSFIVPFKLGELYRWQQLAWVSGNPVGSLLILLLERTLDAVVLLGVLAVVLGGGGRMPPHTAWISGILALATMLGVLAILVVPGCLEAMQSYILRRHSAPRSRRVLRVVDGMRLMIGSVRARLQGNVILLLFISAVIWALESGMLAVLARQLDNESRTFLTSWMTVTLFPQTTAGATTPTTTLYALVGLVTLMAVWPVATALYLGRLQYRRRRQPTEQQPLAVRKPRRIHLHSVGRMQ